MSYLFIAKIDADFTINNYQIINEAIVELEGDTSKTNDALNTLSPLVATKVLENMTKNEIRALASLPPVPDGDIDHNYKHLQYNALLYNRNLLKE
jgi:hypothetical protein